MCLGGLDDGIIVATPVPDAVTASSTRAVTLSSRMRERDDQRARPGEVLPVLVGTQRELEDHHRQVRHGRFEVVLQN